jgi:hypothetical protein
MDVREVISLDSSRREQGFQAAMIAAHTKPPVEFDRYVAEVPSNTRCSMQDYAVDHRCSTHAGAQRQQHDVALSTSCAPQDLSDECCARIVVRRNWKSTSDHLRQVSTFQEMQITRKTIDSRICMVNNSFASDSDSRQGKLCNIRGGLNERAQGIYAPRRRSLKLLKEFSICIDDCRFDESGSDIDAECNCGWIGFIHDGFALYARDASLLGTITKEMD